MTEKDKKATEIDSGADTAADNGKEEKNPAQEKELGGRGGADPTRFGDWEKDGRCVDF